MPPQEQPVPPVQPTPQSKKTWWIVGVVAVIVAVGLGAFVYVFYGSKSGSPVGEVQVQTVTQSATSTLATKEFPYGKWVSLNAISNSLFKVENGQVYIMWQDLSNQTNQTVFPGADPATFQVAFYPVGTTTTTGFTSGEPDSYTGWARDKNTVYHFSDTTDGCVANGAASSSSTNGTSSSISVIARTTQPGGPTVTFAPGTSTGSPSMKICVISTDSASFTPLYHGYMAGDGNVYGDDDVGLVVPNADPATFRFVAQMDVNDGYDHLFEADKNNFYADESIFPGVDAATFTLITDNTGQQSGYAKDKNHVYDAYDPSVVQGADPASFVVLNLTYAKDNQHVYTEDPNVVASTDPPIGWPIPGADPSTFQVVNPPGQCGPNCQYDAQDKNHKYLNGQIAQ